jgi:hypothetical protein
LNSLNWSHIAVEGAVYLIPTLGALYLGFRKLMWVLGEYRPHLHEEKKGEALTADGIRYPRAFNGD